MSDISCIKLLNTIQAINKKPVHDTMIYGKVISVSPLKIEIEKGVVLTESFLFLGQMCRPYKVTIPHTHKYSGKTEKGKATTPGDLIFVGQGKLEEPTGHQHNIKDQETDDVHKENCGTDFEKSVTIEIEPKLKKGDIVLMFAFNNFQKYYVAERIEQEG